MAQPSATSQPISVHSTLTKPTEIRLLSIRAGVFGDKVRCDLINHDLARPTVSYEALSYVWGSNLKPCSIYIGPSRAQFPVTATAHAALRLLRLANNPRVVWVDAICIDQTNIPERNAQVTMMARIYKAASKVVVHLGEASTEVDAALRYLREIGSRNPATDVVSPYQKNRPLRVCDPQCPVWYSGRKSTKAERDMWLGPTAERFSSVWVDEDTPKSITPRFPTKQEAESLLQLFKYPWFTRVWVIQEIFHAADILVLCEPHSFQWISFDWLAEKWFQACFKTGIPTLPSVVDIRNPEKPLKRLWSLLKAFRGCAATDARDKLYGIVSMAADPQSGTLPIDYSAAVPMVYSRVGAILFYQVGLNVLSAVKGRSSIEGLPTWAPDWTIGTGEDQSGSDDSSSNIMRPARPAGGLPDWTVAGLTAAPLPASNWPKGHPGLLLKVRGVKIGRIRWVGEAYDRKTGNWKDVVRQWTHHIRRFPLRQYPSNRAIIPSLSTPDLSERTISQHDHAYSAQFPTQANGKYNVTDMDMFDSLFGAGLFKGTQDIGKLRSEMSKDMDQMWMCKFDSDTLFDFRWPKHPENKFFQDANMTRTTAPASGSEIFYRTLVADDGGLSGADWQTGAYDIFKEGRATVSQAQQSTGREEMQRQTRIQTYEKSAQTAMTGRRVFITDEGYVGLAPMEAQVGDAAVVFLGDVNPSVVRSRGDAPNVEFVGHCYVSGASQAEAVRHIHVSRILAKSPKAPIEDFLIW